MSKTNIDLHLCSKKELHTYLRRSYASNDFQKSSFLLASTIRSRKDLEAVELLLNLPDKSIPYIANMSPLRKLLLGNMSSLAHGLNSEQYNKLIRHQCHYISRVHDISPSCDDILVNELMAQNAPLYREWIAGIPDTHTYCIALADYRIGNIEMDDVLLGIKKGIVDLKHIALSPLFVGILSDTEGRALLRKTNVWHDTLHQHISSTVLRNRTLQFESLLDCIPLDVESPRESTRMLQILRTFFDPHVESCFRTRMNIAKSMIEMPSLNISSYADRSLFFSHPNTAAFLTMINDQTSRFSSRDALELHDASLL